MTRLAHALQDCLETPPTGRARMENRASRYPDLAAELQPLLLVCQRLEEAFHVEPSPHYARAARERFLAALASRRPADTTARRRRAHRRPPRTAATDGRTSPATPTSPAASTSEE